MSDPFGLLGQILENRYRIDACVGEGGFGVVYRATHTTFDEPRAIKLLKVPSHFSGEVRASFVRRFVAEGKLIRKLSEVHTAVVGVDDFGAVMLRGEAVPYLALEWLEGQTLDAYVSSRGALVEAEALALLEPVLEALEKAHDGAAGQVIAHRDIKPENLFVTKGSDGRPRLRVLDFGIAKVMQEGDDAARRGTGLTSTFAAFSPVFGAPEQFLPDEHGATGPHTDVHAMGLVLGFALAGRSPYKGKSQGALMLEAIRAKRPTPRALGASVSDELEACARARCRCPQQRDTGPRGSCERPCRRRLEARAATGGGPPCRRRRGRRAPEETRSAIAPAVSAVAIRAPSAMAFAPTAIARASSRPTAKPSRSSASSRATRPRLGRSKRDRCASMVATSHPVSAAAAATSCATRAGRRSPRVAPATPRHDARHPAAPRGSRK